MTPADPIDLLFVSSDVEADVGAFGVGGARVTRVLYPKDAAAILRFTRFDLVLVRVTAWDDPAWDVVQRLVHANGAQPFVIISNSAPPQDTPASLWGAVAVVEVGLAPAYVDQLVQSILRQRAETGEQGLGRQSS